MPSETRTPDTPASHWAERYTLRGLESPSGLAAFEGVALMMLAGVLTVSASGGADAGELMPPALALGVSGWLIFQGARLARIHHLQTAASTPKATPEKRRLLLNEMFVWLFLSLAALTGAVLAEPEIAGARLLELETPAGLGAFMGLLGAAFIPAIIGIIRTERQLAATRPDRKILREDAISPGSLYVGLMVMALIVLLAWAAARDSFAALGENMGVIVTLFVMFAFLFFIVLSSVTRGLNLFQERDRKPARANGPAASLATVASWIDSILVRIVAPLTGAVQAPDGRHGLGWHHAMIIMILAPLTLLGYALPQPWGLIPIGLAFLFALAIGRRWAWVEGDRETASRLRTTKSKDIHVGFSNDLRDEALLGYSFLFVLVPLTLFQLNEMTGAFCLRGTSASGDVACAAGGGQGAFRDWIGFFGLELLKAVPLVDWVEIYGLNAQPSLMPSPGLDVSKHLMFGSRVLVDFVVMAALFQAISIFQRNHTQRTLYDSGQLDVLDPISEEDFFETGMIKASKAEFESWLTLSPQDRETNPVIDLGKDGYFTAKQSFLDRVETHVREQPVAGIAWPYDRNRLNELVRDPRHDVKAGAKWMIRKYGLLAGDPKHQVSQLADRWQNIQLPVARENVVFVEKQNFEDVIKSAQSNPRDFSNTELGRLAYLLRETCNRPEFAFAHVQAFKLIGMLRTRSAVRLIAASVLKPAQILESELWKTEIEAEFGLVQTGLRQSLDDMRVHAFTALETMAQNGVKYPAYGVGVSTYKLALQLAELGAASDATHSRRAAERARDALSEVLGEPPAATTANVQEQA